jgi:hypothetical protein
METMMMAKLSKAPFLNNLANKIHLIPQLIMLS